MIQFGNDNITDIYVGSDKIKEVYYGSEKVWGSSIPSVIMTSSTNAPVLAICYAQGWCASPYSMTDLEASMVTDIGTAFTKTSLNTDIKRFDEFQYFTGITSLPNDAFKYNAGMTSITIPDGVTSIGDSSFFNCRSLASITIPDGVTSIPYSCFYYCSALTSITIPDGVTSIGEYCLGVCSALTSITIPNSVTTLGTGCFRSCSALTSIYSLRSTAPFLKPDPFGTSSSSYTGRNTYSQGVNTLYVPQGATGYDAGYWLDPLQGATKCGFTISYTL